MAYRSMRRCIRAKWPYWDTDKYKESQTFLPDIVVIMLGTNDIKTENWVEGKANFVKDYTELINVYKNLSSKPDIFVVSSAAALFGRK